MRKSKHLLTLAAILLIVGCGSRGVPPSGVSGAPAATAAVERFLQLAAERDYSGMGWIFGTAEGPILDRDPVPQVEQRMYALASLLEHDGFVIGEGLPVPGRMVDALRFQVLLSNRGENFQVPFTVVQGAQDRWFVEQIGVEAITER
ncbi:MAG: hypothetical protein WD737_01375 [Gemmatimonadota bacterium]